jgi:tetratricopeptide (TPR) repeat protein
VSLATCEYSVGHLIGAHEALEQALKLNSHDVKMWQDWGALLWGEDNKDGAISFLEEGIKLNPQMAELYYQIAAYFFAKKKASKGATYLENGLILDPSKHDILYDTIEETQDLPVVKNLIAQYVIE